MSDKEIATISAWLASGCPKGDPKDATSPRLWSSDWALGTPDFELSMSETYRISAEGRDEHRVFVIPTGLTAGKWLSFIDFKPGNPRVVHHILAAFDAGGRTKKLDDADKDPGYKVFGGFGIVPSGVLADGRPENVC